MKAVERYLNDQGFVANRPVELTDTPTFSGRLEPAGRSIQVELRFPEGIYDYPTAFLPEWQHDEKLRHLLGIHHIDARGHLCYEDTSRTWWDSSMATEMVSGVLQRVEGLLLDIIAGKVTQDDIAPDFLGYWDGSTILYVTEKLQNGQQLNRLNGASGKSGWLVRKDKDHWVGSDKIPSNELWLVHRLKHAPTKINPDKWPTTSVGDVFLWLGENSQKEMEALVKRLSESVKTKSKNSGLSRTVGIVLIWPDDQGEDTLGCAFSFNIPKNAHSSISGQRHKFTTLALKKDGTPVTRYNLAQADQDYILTRNNPSSDNKLKNRKVILVGAGTIGGYLAKLLCAQGAGSGSRGVLHIVDPDFFSIENIGRHFLGILSLEKNKANALVDALAKEAPFLKLRPHDSSITKRWDLISNDAIVIDATGCQTVGIAVAQHLSLHEKNNVVLQ